MKVNISYAVELENVPSEISKLLENCEQKLRALHADMDMIELDNPSKFLSDVQEMRESLSDLDLRLSDCSRIMSGFLDIKTRLLNGELQPEQGSEEVEENDES